MFVMLPFEDESFPFHFLYNVIQVLVDPFVLQALQLQLLLALHVRRIQLKNKRPLEGQPTTNTEGWNTSDNFGNTLWKTGEHTLVYVNFHKVSHPITNASWVQLVYLCQLHARRDLWNRCCCWRQSCQLLLGKQRRWTDGTWSESTGDLYFRRNAKLWVAESITYCICTIGNNTCWVFRSNIWKINVNKC